MKQYLELLNNIAENGTDKPGAREGMPGTTSLFGPQIEMDLKDGFPLLTTKKMYWKGVVVELLWFLRGDTNIKYLVDNGCSIWNEDAYNYYQKLCKRDGLLDRYTFEGFIKLVREGSVEQLSDKIPSNYTLGDCGFQYGKVWRKYGDRVSYIEERNGEKQEFILNDEVDQLVNVITNLRFNPQSRRHLVTAIDPSNDQNLALYWCHALFQFNARPITYYNTDKCLKEFDLRDSEVDKFIEENNYPKYYLDCKLYQRSADVILGVPFNIASYALLVEVISSLVGMVPGRFIHSFGDVHIYSNHIPAFLEQREREPKKLPSLEFSDEFKLACKNGLEHGTHKELFSDMIKGVLETLEVDDFSVKNYTSHTKIVAKLSTGLQ